MTTGSGQAIGAAQQSTQQAAESGWDIVRADETIQYQPLPRPEAPETPGWLTSLMQFLYDLFSPIGAAFGGAWPVVKWLLIVGGAALLLYLLWKLLAPVLDLGGGKRGPIEAEWAPSEDEALALLEDADRLAAAGQYDAATHLLLKRSVGQIADARPGLVEPSSTARELAALPALPVAARSAFGTIADRVERSLFALRRLGEEDWQAARSAYAQFALQSLASDRS